MNLFSKIIIFFLLILFGQQSSIIIYAVELIRPIEENNNITEEEHSEIARNCNLEKDFVNYWERDGRSLAAGAGTGKVWDDIIPTQPLYDANSLINKSFEINIGNNKIWVHGNATEHLRELELNILKDISKTSASADLQSVLR